MHVLQIEHPVPNYEGWKRAFDSDPVNRKQSGVRRYKISRKVDNANYVIVDLEFDNLNEAQACETALRNLWSRVEGSIINTPQSRIMEVVEIEDIF